MIQIYVTKLPTNKEECPFWDVSESHCNVNNGNCCLCEKDKCGHLLDMSFDFLEVESVENE